jgi:hypothetical protein
MADKKNPEPPPKFRFSVKIDFKQTLLIGLILSIFIAIPIVVNYLQNPNRRPIDEILSQTVESIKIKSYDTDSPFMINIPIVNKELDLTILKQNPQLLIFAGIIFGVFSMLTAITLLRGSNKR